MGLKQLSKGTLESGKIHVSGAFGWCLISERCSNANMQMQLRFPSPHGDHGGLRGAVETIKSTGGPKGAWRTEGATGFHGGLQRGLG
jgi:hypothetical protein